MSNKNEKGSEWRKWDLHIHTPDTKLNNGGYDSTDGKDKWDNFCEKIEKSDVKVFGITDYFSVDNYFNFLSKFKEKYPSSKKVFFPNIEFRLISSSNNNGDEHDFHLIFNPKYKEKDKTLKNILDDFLSNLKLYSEDANGRSEKANNLQNENDFKTASTTKEFIEEALKETFGNKNPYLKISMLHGHGGLQPITRKVKIAEKLDKFSDIFFGCDDKDVKFGLSKRGNIDKKKPVITGSDLHSFNDFGKKVGKKFKNNEFKTNEKNIRFTFPTWIKADPTFEGLKQIIYEPEERVFIGEKPEVLDRVRNNKTKYIKSLKIDQVNLYNDKKNIWFKNEEIELNKELVAIIGNKGNGKSAIADILGFLGNTHNSGEGKENNFSFLNGDRFKKDKLANNFEGTLFWEDGTENKKNLGIDEIDKSNSEKVRYLPQNFFNTLTNNLDNNKFTETLENVIFSHLDDSLKLGKTSFSELKEYKTKIINEKIEQIKINLIEINKNIVNLEKKKQPKEIEKIENKITEKENELKVQEKLLKELKEIKNPSEDSNISDENKKKFEEIETINGEIKDLDKEIEETKILKSKLEIDKQTLNDFLGYFESIEKQVGNYKTENKDKYLSLGLDINKIINLEIKKEKVDDKLKEVETSLNDLKYKFTEKVFLNLNEDEKIQKIIKENSLVIKKEELLEKIEKIKKDLSQQEKDYQNYLEEKKRIENKIEEIKGEKKEGEEEYKFDTLEYYKKIKDYLPKKNESGKTQLEKELDKLIEERLKLSVEIYNNKKEIIDLYKQFKEPIDKKVKENEKDLNKENKINIDVRFKIKQDFDKNFLNFINQGKKGSFSGKNEGEQKLKEIYNDKDFSNENNIKEILNDFIKYIQIDKREEYKDKDITDKERSVFEQINEPEEFYNYIFSLDYIDTEFELKSGEKSLEKLSPGEKGTLLLIFYLMIDEEGIPLIIDQPEDNLDNQSVFSMLSKFIKKAKKKRQIIIVTHNPNLAVGADAEQIIYTKIDKENGNTFSFESGSIENKIINNHIVDILEGTMSAFNKRELKYIK